MQNLLHESILHQAELDADHLALVMGETSRSYGELAAAVENAAAALARLGLEPGQRVAVYQEKRLETVIGLYGALHAGGVMVPINPLLKAAQVAHIVRDSGASVFITTGRRYDLVAEQLSTCPDLKVVIRVDPATSNNHTAPGPALLDWTFLAERAESFDAPRRIDSDLVSILYTSGSTGRPKGVVLSHRNMVSGAQSVASYLENHRGDRILSALPLSFDAGFSQLSTGFHAGACIYLLNYLVPNDCIKAVERHRITGLTAVPPLWIPLSRLAWTEGAVDSIRYIANTGGAMPRAVVDALRVALPRTQVFLMYGLTEAFRSTYLPPNQLDKRPDSIGKAIPNAEVMVVRPDGTPCDPEEPGELVHRGALVAQGYWNDPARTAERFKPAPARPDEVPLTEVAVWSGDTVRKDAEGYLYFVGRGDDMIKSSGYRISPTEIEEIFYASGLVAEAAAVGIAHPLLGQGLVVSMVPAQRETFSVDTILAVCREQLPNFMVPAHVQVCDSLPRNPNGKIDRRAIVDSLDGLFEGTNV